MNQAQFKSLLMNTVRRGRGEPMIDLHIHGTVDFTDWSWGEETRTRVNPKIIARVIDGELQHNTMAYLDNDESRLRLSISIPLSTDGVVVTCDVLPLLQELLSDYEDDDLESFESIEAQWKAGLTWIEAAKMNARKKVST